MPRYLIGIDLGTTNSALAVIDASTSARTAVPKIVPLPVPQVVSPGEVKDRALLPSFLYLPGEHDLPPGAVALPWDPARNYAVGEFARVQGGRVPGRLVSSAKSWLCHAGVDRNSALLPWAAPPDVPRISPVEASARYLLHLVEAWNTRMAKTDADRIEKQTVVLTVPASFDDVARTLTVEAAKKAGLEEVVLIEEPQAAFYCWLATHPPAEATALKPGSRCLVVDVGGGTSDFSLIEAIEQEGEIGFVRQAVGDHLLLGGDNMDLALARAIETRLNVKLDATQFGQLTQACRAAKEQLLSDKPPASVPVTVVGRGRSVIAGTLTTQLTPDDVRQVLFEGFFPHTARGTDPQRPARAGLHEMGLPYVADAAVTRHLAAFLRNQGDTPPAAILYNGGVFQPASLRQRLLDVMAPWYSVGGKDWSPLVLTSPSLDLAVALGAAYYGWLRHIGGRRIGGGIPRSYYVGLAPESPDATEHTVLCVVPQHLEEGHDLDLPKPELELALGQPVIFPLFTSTMRGDDKPGEVLKLAADKLQTLPPLHTILRGGKRAGTKRVPVTLASRITPIGTLELFCVAQEGGNRWKLEFNIRELVKEPPRPAARGEDEPVEAGPGLTDVWLEPQVEEAGRRIYRAFRGPEKKAPADAVVPTPQELTKSLEAALEAGRSEWPSGLCRRLWEYLAEVADDRRKSGQHMARWHNLVGYCLRPGFGDPLDRFRVEQLWKLVFAPLRQEAGKPVPMADGGADFWIMWRRLSGGLATAHQNALFDRLRGAVLPTKGKAGVKPSTNELAEMYRCAGSLERLDAKIKESIGTILLGQVKKSPTPPYLFWTLTRLGARQLVYGPLNTVLHPDIARTWLEQVVGFEAGNEHERLSWAFCLAEIARLTGQRALDVDDSIRRTVLSALRAQTNLPAGWITMVEEVVEPESADQGRLLGDELPIGLRLVRE
jgi:hypothetical protein